MSQFLRQLVLNNCSYDCHFATAASVYYVHIYITTRGWLFNANYRPLR